MANTRTTRVVPNPGLPSRYDYMRADPLSQADVITDLADQGYRPTRQNTVPSRTDIRRGPSYFTYGSPPASIVQQEGTSPKRMSLRSRLGRLFSGGESILTGVLGEGTEKQTILGMG